jgi:hypothetical protein
VPLIGNRSGWFGFDRARTSFMSNQSGSWTPASLGSALKTFVRADSVKGRTAAQFTAANSESLSKTDNAELDLGDINCWFAAWIYLDSTGNMTVYGKSWGGSGRTLLLWKPSAAAFRLSVSSDGTTQTDLNATTFGVPSTGVWLFLMVYHDATNNLIGISVNGGAFNTAAHTGGVFTNNSALTLGNDALAGTGFWNGRMAGVCFGKSNTETFANIRDALYNGGTGLDLADVTAAQRTAWGAISAWPMREESGTRADIWSSNTLTDNNTVTANDGKVAYAVTADASVVAIGTDQGAAALTIQQAVHASKPLLKTAIINSQNVLRFDGVDDFLKVATGAISNQPLWGWAVVDDNDAATRYYLDGGAASKVSLFHDGTNLNINGGSSVGAAHSAGAPHLVTFSVNGASSQIWVDGTSLATGDAGAQNQDSGIAIGADNAGASPLAGDIAEIAIVAGSPTAADLANLKAYINSRYNLGVA